MSNAARAVPVWVFRVVVMLHALLVCLQPFSAGAFLSGQFGMLTMHTAVGGTVFLVGIVQAVVAVLLWRPARLTALPILLSVVIVAAELVQMVAGIERVLWLHLPLGVFLVVVVLWLTSWSVRLPTRLPSRAGDGRREEAAVS